MYCIVQHTRGVVLCILLNIKVFMHFNHRHGVPLINERDVFRE